MQISQIGEWLRLSLRGIFRQRTYAFFVAGLLAIGLASLTTTAGFFQSAFLEPYQRWRNIITFETGDSLDAISPPHAAQLQEYCGQTLQGVGLTYVRSANVAPEESGGERVRMALVSHNALDLVGAKATLGSLFSPDLSPSVIISHDVWVRVFSQSDDVLGRQLSVNESPRSVIGVLPPRFDFPDEDIGIWIPISDELPGAGTQTSARIFNYIARLTPGTSLAVANENAGTFFDLLRKENPRLRQGPTPVAVSYAEMRLGAAAPALNLLLLGGGAVMLLAHLNILQLARLRLRTQRQEQAVRLSLGASIGQLWRSIVFESMAIYTFGVVAGFVLTFGLHKIIFILDPGQSQGLALSVFPFGIFATIALLSSIGPLLTSVLAVITIGRESTFRDLVSASGNTLRSTSGLRQAGFASLSIQSSFTIFLVMMTLTVAQSFANLRRLKLGFDSEGVVVAQISLFPRLQDGPSQARFLDQLKAKLEENTQVEKIAYASDLPMSGSGYRVRHSVRRQNGEVANFRASLYRVSPSFFDLMRVRILNGRVKRNVSERSYLLDSRLASHLRLDSTPIAGADLTTGRASASSSWFQVTGIAHAIVQQHPLVETRARPTNGHVYEIISGVKTLGAVHLVVRSQAKFQDIASIIRRDIWQVDPLVAIGPVRSMDNIVSDIWAPTRFHASVFGGFAVASLILAGVAIYGLSLNIGATRRYEFAVRTALGAQRSQIFRMVVVQAFKPVLVGTLVGGCLVLATSQLLQYKLFEVGQLNIGALLWAATAQAVLVLTSSFRPALRTARQDPTANLKAL